VDEVRLPDLQTIRRYSIAVRQEHAPLGEVLDALRADLARLERQVSPRKSEGRKTTSSRPSRARGAAPRRRSG